MKVILVILAMVMMSGLFGCSQPVSGVMVLQSDKARLTPAPAAADISGLVKGNTEFALDAYQSLKDGDNLFYSPYSISEALAMVYGGARGETEKQMAEALRFNLSQAQLHPAFNSLDLELAKRGQGAKGQDEKGFRLRVVNAIWGQQGFNFRPAYLDLLALNYGAGLRVVDFQKATEASRNTINQWVTDQTEGKIKDLIPQGALNAMTRLVLTNAVYFNAAWQYPFQKESTSIGSFTLLDGNKVNVPMMRNMASYGYAKGENYQVVELPYDGRELVMAILVPDQGKFRTVETLLKGAEGAAIIGQAKAQPVVLTMPKFRYESSLGLKATLSALGMPVAFTDNADLSGMDGKRDLLISDVLHKAFVSVDEAGTEAAAATGVIVGVTSAVQNPVALTIDRPFIFFIRDIKTGAVLFIGRVLKPAQ